MYRCPQTGCGGRIQTTGLQQISDGGRVTIRGTCRRCGSAFVRVADPGQTEAPWRPDREDVRAG